LGVGWGAPHQTPNQFPTGSLRIPFVKRSDADKMTK